MALKNLLNRTCIVERKVRASDGQGGYTTSWQEIQDARIRRGLWADSVQCRSDRFQCTVFLLKDGPEPDLVFPVQTADAQ